MKTTTEPTGEPVAEGNVDVPRGRAAATEWLEEWIRLGSTATRDLSPAPTAAEILAADRDRSARRSSEAE